MGKSTASAMFYCAICFVCQLNATSDLFKNVLLILDRLLQHHSITKMKPDSQAKNQQTLKRAGENFVQIFDGILMRSWKNGCIFIQKLGNTISNYLSKLTVL